MPSDIKTIECLAPTHAETTVDEPEYETFRRTAELNMPLLDDPNFADEPFPTP
jgi:hypothetical protein